MIVRAVVLIDLKLDGTWKIMQMFPAKEEDLFPDDELKEMKERKEEPVEFTQVPKEPSASWHLANAKRVREERKQPEWKVNHKHCSICGECGKSRQTHRTRRDGSTYHVGEPFNGKKCKTNKEN